MNRPALITLIGTASLVLAAALSAAQGQTDERLDESIGFINNFSHENAVCGAYALMVHQCLKNRNSDAKLAADFYTMGDNFLQRSVSTGKVAGLSQKALDARVTIAIDDMKADTDSNCINISVLFQKHAKVCKTLYEDGPSILSNAVKRLSR